MNHALEPLAGCPFAIMDGAGNDFVIADLREGGMMTAAAARHLGDRAGPFGCDQVITIEPGPAMGIWNADGSRAGACGNAARCVAKLLLDEQGGDAITFGSPAGPLQAVMHGDLLVDVDMGEPRFAWDEIPLGAPVESTLHLPLPESLLARFGLAAPAGVSMGNPHAVFFVEDSEAAALTTFGPLVETDPLFPDRCNVSVVSRRGGALRVRTWERGVGITKACGTAACASLVAAHRLGLAGREANVIADGGTLTIRWDETSGHVHMAGPVRLHRRGTF